MEITPTDPATGVVTVTGPVGPADLTALRLALVGAVEGTDGPLLVDTRGVTAFDDACLDALVAARSRAKWHRRSVAVLAAVGAPVEVSLRRAGHLARMPVHPDVETARADQEQRTAARAAMTLVPGGGVAGSATDDGRGPALAGVANPHRQTRD